MVINRIHVFLEAKLIFSRSMPNREIVNILMLAFKLRVQCLCHVRFLRLKELKKLNVNEVQKDYLQSTFNWLILEELDEE